jgi:transcriptional regulator
MYVPPLFALDASTAVDFVRRHPFATLFTAGALGPYASHVPLVPRGDALVGHLARANPQCGDLGNGLALAVFAGPHAAVDPAWYEHPARQVPTWNYVAVHVRGRVVVLDDARAALEALTSATGLQDPVSDGTPERERLVEGLARGVVAFELRDLAWEGKAKLSQNRTPADRERVRLQLAASEDPVARAVAQWMSSGAQG